MMAQTLSHFHLPWLTCVGLLLFLGVFLGACVWVWRKDSEAFYKRLERLPFENSEPKEHV